MEVFKLKAHRLCELVTLLDFFFFFLHSCVEIEALVDLIIFLLQKLPYGSSQLFFVAVRAARTAHATVESDENTNNKLQKKLSEKIYTLSNAIQSFSDKKYWTAEDNDHVHFELEVKTV